MLIPEGLRKSEVVTDPGVCLMVGLGPPWHWQPSVQVSQNGCGVSFTWGWLGLYLIPKGAGRVLVGLVLMNRFLRAQETQEEWAMFNQDQIDHMKSLAKTPPEKRCYCGWSHIDEQPPCPRCPLGPTLATRFALMCPHCHSAPPAADLTAPIIHTSRCRLQADKKE